MENFVVLRAKKGRVGNRKRAEIALLIDLEDFGSNVLRDS
jgi:hypothetical protein